MRVGVYVDAFNLYYGGRALCGQSAAGWRWLDIRELVQPFVGWSNSVVDRVVYCPARVDGSDDLTSFRDRAIHLEALAASECVDHIEEGRCVSWAKEAPLAGMQSGSHSQPRLCSSDGSEVIDERLPIRAVQDRHSGQPILLATIRAREEKGSDVSVATHLLHDVLSGAVDGAVVVSNDSDLSLRLQVARRHGSVGTVNPTKRYLAGALRGRATEGPGRHWWKQLTAADFLRSQLPDPAAGRFIRPAGW